MLLSISEQVVMLGRYNAQGLGNAVEALTKQIVVTAGTYQTQHALLVFFILLTSCVGVWHGLCPKLFYIICACLKNNSC